MALRVVVVLVAALLALVPARAETVLARHGAGEAAILWIGNSHTARWQVAGMVAAMAAASGRPVTIRTATQDGHGLSDTLAEPAVAALLAGEWDAVVLQDWSWNAIRRPEVMTGALDALLPRAGRVVIAQNWAYSAQNRLYADGAATPEGVQARIDALFAGFPSRYGAVVAPAGRAIRRGEAAGLGLVSADGNHLTEAGAAVLAASVFRALWDAPPPRPPGLDPGLDWAALLALIEPPWRP